VSAYDYPRQYGPAAPSFSRAALTPDPLLLISGTASIVGHASVHLGDVTAQLEETLANLANRLRAGTREHDRVSVVVRRRLDTLHDFGDKRIGDGRHDHPYRSASPRDQASGSGVRGVTHLEGDGLDPFARRGIDQCPPSTQDRQWERPPPWRCL
jgi:hypothetical protein